MLFALCLVTVLSVAYAAQAWWRLTRRLRYMLLVLFLLFCWHTPGTLVWPQLGVWSPTLEGCRLALDHTARILLVVAIVGLMLRLLNHAQWVQGLYGLLAPLQRLGLPSARLAVRLQLVLQEAEYAERLTWRDWLSASSAEKQESALPLRLSPLRTFDVVAVTALLLLACTGLLWGSV